MEKTNLKCLKCGSLNLVKNGWVFGVQRYRCCGCGYQFTKTAPAGKSIFIKIITHTLYLSGLSMREVAPIVGVTVQTVSRWIRKWHLAYMNDVGNKSKIYRTTVEDLNTHLNLSNTDKLMIMTTKLPSGAICHSIIQIPSNQNLSLEE